MNYRVFHKLKLHRNTEVMIIVGVLPECGIVNLQPFINAPCVLDEKVRCVWMNHDAFRVNEVVSEGKLESIHETGLFLAMRPLFRIGLRVTNPALTQIEYVCTTLAASVSLVVLGSL